MLKLLVGHWVSQEQFVLLQMPIMAGAMGQCGWTTWSVQGQRQASRVVGTTVLGLLTQTVGTIITMLEWCAPMVSVTLYHSIDIMMWSNVCNTRDTTPSRSSHITLPHTPSPQRVQFVW